MQDIQEILRKSRIKAMAVGLTESLILIILLGFIISNDTDESENIQTSKADEPDFLTNEDFTLLLSLILVMVTTSILLIVGAQQRKGWLMMPYIGIHIAVVIFFAIVWIVWVIRLREDSWLILKISIYGAMLIALVTMALKPVVENVLHLIIKNEINKIESAFPTNV